MIFFLLLTFGALCRADYGGAGQCHPTTVTQTFYATVNQQVPVEEIIYTTQIVPTTFYKNKLRNKIETSIQYLNYPQYITTTVTSYQNFIHTDIQLDYRTAYQTRIITNTESIPTYITQVSTSTLTVESPVIRYEQTTEYLPSYVTQTEVSVKTVYQDHIVPKYYTETVVVPDLITVCPNNGLNGGNTLSVSSNVGIGGVGGGIGSNAFGNLGGSGFNGAHNGIVSAGASGSASNNIQINGAKSSAISGFKDAQSPVIGGFSSAQSSVTGGYSGVPSPAIGGRPSFNEIPVKDVGAGNSIVAPGVGGLVKVVSSNKGYQ